MTDLITLYGTDEPPVPRRRYDAGPLSFDVEAGALRHIRVHGVEAIRGIAFLVRDRDWGTLVPRITDETVEEADDGITLAYTARFDSNGATLTVRVTLSAGRQGLRMAAQGRATGAFETNRAGFTVLHPINGVAGAPLRVAHSDGTTESGVFPALIAPWQPFMDITALTHTAGAHEVTCGFSGDTVEMEDQRQWGDASYKTYNRPLAKPWPYLIDDGETLDQAVTLTWEAAAPVATTVPAPPHRQVTFPQTALVITPACATRLAATPDDLAVVGPQRLLCHLDATLGDTAAQWAAFAQAQAACPDVAFDVELICRCAGGDNDDPEPELAALAQEMRQAGLRPDSILVCPSVDRQSTPPGSDWPPCPPLDRLHAAAARVFDGVTRGGGMVSFFPELNRKRPPVEALDFVSHGLCPIVHAADDISVMETLEAVSHITASARAIIGDRPYRIGPATIAMRQNPYGARTIPNPDHGRVCMADDDPRHRARFGAAYAVGLAAALAPAGVEVWTPAALYGPRGVIGGDAALPLAEALRALATLSGSVVDEAACENGKALLRAGAVEVVANLKSQDTPDLPAFGWRKSAHS